MKLDQIGDVSVDETVQGQTSLCIYQTHTNKIETKQIKKNLKLNCVKLRLNWQKTYKVKSEIRQEKTHSVIIGLFWIK